MVLFVKSWEKIGNSDECLKIQEMDYFAIVINNYCWFGHWSCHLHCQDQFLASQCLRASWVVREFVGYVHQGYVSYWDHSKQGLATSRLGFC